MDTAQEIHHLLICTVGGTPEPIIAAIRFWKPARVLFLPSEGTRNDAETVTKEPGLLQPGDWDMIILGDAQDFGDCVRRMSRLDEVVAAWQHKGAAYDVIVDFTGGTKCMSAALATVSRRWPCAFSYIGGSERTKGGKGIVVAGREQTLVTQNPWNALGYQAVEDACLMFDQQAFMSAASLLDQARKAADDESVRRTLSTFHRLCEGYGLWDRFQHTAALQRLDDVLKNANDLRAVLGVAQFELVQRAVRDNKQTLERLAAEPHSRAMVADLVANAGRRRREARFDDGVARLYRAIESLAQLALAQRHGIAGTDAVPLERVPESLRETWRYRAERGTLRLGLQDAFELLDALGDDAGKTFKAMGLQDRKRSPLAARNQSILAHGFQPVGERVFQTLWDAAIRLGGFSEQELPLFPCLTKVQAAPPTN